MVIFYSCIWFWSYFCVDSRLFRLTKSETEAEGETEAKIETEAMSETEAKGETEVKNKLTW